MKKFIIAMSLLLLLCGCEKGTEVPAEISEASQSVTTTTAAEAATASETMVTTVETTTVTTTETTVTTTEETTVTERKYIENEEYLMGFLSYLQHKGFVEGERNYFVFEQGNSFDQYDFMDDFKIDGYSYQHRGNGVYDVKLTCSDSTCDIFPNGDSYWYANTNRYGNFYFCPAKRENEVMFSKDYPIPLEKTVYTAYSAAVDFSFYTKTFEADKEWFENYTEASVHGFYHAYNPYMEKDKLTGGVYPEEQIRAVKLLYNIDIPIESFDYLSERGLVDDGKVFSFCGHGGGWYYETFVGYEETDSEITVRVDYYGDELYFYPVIQSEYTFSKNADGSITLQKVEKIFDRGYRLASGTV